MQVLITGVGDAFTRHHFSTSALLRAPDGLVLIDCPDLIHRVLREATARARWKAEAADIHDIILTHLHGDHCNGLESFGFYRWVLRQRDPDLPRPRLHTTAEVAARVWKRLAPAMDAPLLPGGPKAKLADYYELKSLKPGRTAKIAGLKVRCRFTKHPVPTVGLMISDGKKTLGWSGDTPFEKAHVNWLSKADKIVHESNRGPAHTPIESLNALPKALRSKMHLIHLPDDFDPKQTDLKILRQGQVLKV